MKTLLSNKTYEILKWITIIALPAVTIFVKTIFPVWNIPFADQISTTLMAIDTLIGALICVSTVQYNKGTPYDYVTINQPVDLTLPLSDTYTVGKGDSEDDDIK